MTKIPSIRVTETPVAVPESLQRYGLSEVVNHLLGREPPTPFDMLVMGRFLRSSLASVMRKNALSGEAVLEVEYLPALRQPTEAETADQVAFAVVNDHIDYARKVVLCIVWRIIQLLPSCRCCAVLLLCCSSLDLPVVMFTPAVDKLHVSAAEQRLEYSRAQQR